MAYQMEFEKAFKTSVENSILPPGEISWDRSGQFLTSKIESPDFTRRLVESIVYDGARRLDFNCAETSILAKRFIEKNFPSKVYLTIGWVEKAGVELFKFEKWNALELLRNAESTAALVARNELPLHVWLTISTGEILDMTIGTTMAKANLDSSYDDGVICGVADHLPTLFRQLKFHPVVVGENYLVRVGALRFKPPGSGPAQV